MHLIKDENGNLVQHGHEHTPEHSHEHTHADGVTHTHAHTHGDGDHTHSHGDCGSCEGGELDQMADNLQKMGLDNSAKTIKEAVADFQKGNMRLGLALTLVKEEMK